MSTTSDKIITPFVSILILVIKHYITVTHHVFDLIISNRSHLPYDMSLLSKPVTSDHPLVSQFACPRSAHDPDLSLLLPRVLTQRFVAAVYFRHRLAK